MAPKASKAGTKDPKTEDENENTMGVSPAALLSRLNESKGAWCPKKYNFNDAFNPKSVSYKDIHKVLPIVREKVEKTPVQMSRVPEKFGCNLYYKIETLNPTGSFKIRGAWTILNKLSEEEKEGGIITVSLGNFASAIAYCAQILHIKTRIVFPKGIAPSVVKKCKDYGAKVFIRGECYKEAKLEAFQMANHKGLTYIHGYDHLDLIAANGTIGLEIMEDVPDVEIILIPVGAGALIAGVAEAVKQINPDVRIYGVQTNKACGFFKALEKEGVFQTEITKGLASGLEFETPGSNAYYTAKRLVYKMVLVNDDWIARAVCHLVEEEKLAVEGAGATGLSALFAMRNILPELRDKKVVCILTGANWDHLHVFTKCLERAKALEGRLIKLNLKVLADDPKYMTHALSMVANTGANVLQCHVEHSWITENDLRMMRIHLVMQCNDLEHACSVKRVIEKLFPESEFSEEPFTPLPICVCFPKIYKGLRQQRTE